MKFKTLADRNICMFENLGLNYWSIPKNASTTLKVHFSTLDQKRQKIDMNVYESLPNDRARLAYENEQSDGIEYIPESAVGLYGFDNVLFTRHPHKRCVSIYKFTYGNEWYRKKVFAPGGRFDKIFPVDATFEEFFAIVQEKELWKDFDSVFYPQVYWMPTSPKIKQNIKLIDVDYMHEMWPWDFEKPDFKVNVSEGAEDFKLTQEEKDLIYEIYSDDFDTFWYD